MKTLALVLLFFSAYAHADYNTDIHARMDRYFASNKECYDKATNLSEQTACVKTTVNSLNVFMESFLNGWYPNLIAGPRGTEVYEQLVATQALWVQYRRDLCNFAADAKSNDKDLAAFHGLHCVMSVTIARIRELNPIR